MAQNLSVTLLPEHAALLQNLSDSDIAKLVRHIIQYLTNQDVTALDDPVLNMIFNVILSGKTPDRRSVTSVQNGRLGGRPKGSKNKKPNLKIGFFEDEKALKNEENEKSPNNILFIKEELFNRGNIQSDNILSNDNNYLPSLGDNNNQLKEKTSIINYRCLKEKGAFKDGNVRKKPSKESPKESIDWDELTQLYNGSLQDGGMKPIIRITDRRKSFIASRAHEFGIEAVKTAILKAAASDFLNGRHPGRPWMATFDWLFLPTNFHKVLEGNYDNKNNTPYGTNNNQESSRQERLEGYSRTVQALLDEAANDACALANHSGLAQGFPGITAGTDDE